MTGIGLNTHSQLLPLDKIKAIGVQWVRGDSGNFVKWAAFYKGFGLYWSLPMDSTAPDVARACVQAGITNLGLGNEPDGPWSFKSGAAWTPAQFATYSRQVRAAVGHSATLYGPCTSSVDPTYAIAALKAGATWDQSDFHGYRLDANSLPGLFKSGICGEVGYQSIYPWTFAGPVDLFLKLKAAMKVPWCFYDGPNANADKTVGLFDSADGGATWTVPTATYEGILGRSAVT